MFENMTEQQAREQILAVNIITKRKHLKRETEFLMHPEFMIQKKW